MMDKLISQQAAINVVSEITTTMSVCTNKDECYGMKRMQKQAITELANLPSVEPEAISKWKKEFREYVDSLDIARDDWKGIIEYIDELPSAEPDTTTHDSIPAETGKNDGVGTSGDCISRQQAIDALRKMQTYKLFAGDDMILVDKAQVQTELMMLPSVQPETNCSEISNNSDAISRQAAIDFVGSMNMCDEISNEACKKLTSYLDELPSIQSEQQWVPCSERLPEEPYGCLATVWDTNPVTMDEFENILPYFVGWDGEQWNDGDGEQCPFEVIAWMPLPEPYQGVER